MEPGASTAAPGQPQQPAPLQQRSEPEARVQAPQMIQYAAQPIPLTSLSNAVTVSKTWHIVKVVLGCSSIVTCVILYGIGIYFLLSGYGYRTDFEFAFVASAAGLALIWQASEFITIWVSGKNRRGIHPGAHVALHLLIWLLSGVAIAFLAIGVASDLSDLAYYNDTGSTSYDYNDNSSYDDADYSSFLSHLISLEEAMLAFTGLLVLLHFVLFVRACVETNYYNTASRTIYLPLPAPPPSAQGTQYAYYAPVPAPQGSMTKGPITQVPMTQVPIAQSPNAQTLISQGPVSQGPVSQGPVSQGPVNPVGQGPASQVPVNQGPINLGAHPQQYQIAEMPSNQAHLYGYYAPVTPSMQNEKWLQSEKFASPAVSPAAPRRGPEPVVYA